VALLTVLPAPQPSAPFRSIFVRSVIPGLAAVAAFAVLVREAKRPGRQGLRFWGALGGLPKRYKRFLRGVGLFGMGDFSHTLLILAAARLLTPSHGAVRAAEIAGLLYVVRNVFYAGASFPIGAIADKTNKQKLLAGGYFVGALTALGTGALFSFSITSIGLMGLVFVLAGIYIAVEDALEGAIPADLVSSEARGTAYGLMGTVNGVGDLVASALVGSLWTAVSPVMAFGCAGFLMLLGAILLLNSEH
jgi:MFS family permease